LFLGIIIIFYSYKNFTCAINNDIMKEIRMHEQDTNDLSFCRDELEALLRIIVPNEADQQHVERVDDGRDLHDHKKNKSSSTIIDNNNSFVIGHYEDWMKCEQPSSSLMEKCQCQRDIILSQWSDGNVSSVSTTTMMHDSSRSMQSLTRSNNTMTIDLWLFITIAIGAFVAVFLITWLVVYCFYYRNQHYSDSPYLHKTGTASMSASLSAAHNNDHVLDIALSNDTDIRVYDVQIHHDDNDDDDDTTVPSNAMNRFFRKDDEVMMNNDIESVMSNPVMNDTKNSSNQLNSLNTKLDSTKHTDQSSSIQVSYTFSNRSKLHVQPPDDDRLNNNNNNNNSRYISPTSFPSNATTPSDASVPSSIRGRVKTMTQLWESGLRILLLSSTPKPNNDHPSPAIQRQSEQQQSRQQAPIHLGNKQQQSFLFWNNEVEDWKPSYIPTSLVRQDDSKRLTTSTCTTRSNDVRNVVDSAASSPVSDASVSAIPVSLRQRVSEMTKSWEQGLRFTLSTPK
jgi:hypothetical protein